MSQFDAFRNYLDKFLSIPPLEWLQMIRYLSLRKVQKGEHYYRQGDGCVEIGFVIKGILYNYYLTADGEKFVKRILQEGEPVAPYTNLLLGTPASFNCEAIETSTLITLKYADLQKLYQRHSCWERMGRVSAERLFIEKEERELEFLTMNAAARYEAFAKRNPQLIDRVPQYLIASYIGISPASLSRLRKNL